MKGKKKQSWRDKLNRKERVLLKACSRVSFEAVRLEKLLSAAMPRTVNA